MPGENQNVNQVQKDNAETRLSNAQMQKERNIANNANNVKAAADIASKSANPYAKAIGGAVKAADKLSGGRASQKLGKTLNTANKITPGGRMLQKGLNKMSESGTSNRISNAVNKKKSMPTKSPMSVQGSAEAKGKDNDYFSRKEVEEQTSDGGGVSFQATVKFIKTALIAMIPVMVVVVFLNLLTSASLAVRNIIGIGSADTISDANMNDKISNAKSEDLENNDKSNEPDESAFEYDFFIEDKVVQFRNSKLKKINNVIESNIREGNEADITQLKDYYPDIANYEEAYDKDIVHTFFFKLHYLYFYYQNNYKVSLDIPLMMATLSINSNDMQNVFESNIIGYDEKQLELKSDNERFNYTYPISYESTSTSAEYDMEILAQYMVSKVPYVESEKTCDSDDVIDGMCYIVDYDKYNEFLEEYLEKKYYEGGTLVSSGGSSTSTSSNVCTITQFTKYALTEDQLKQIASLAYHEQGTAKGAAAEASLMANLFEIKGSKYGTEAEGLYNYVRNSGWFANAASNMDEKSAPVDVVNAVKSVLVDGKRTIPGYIDEHDWINNISSAKTDGKEISISDKASYVRHNTKLKNIYGATYTFYSFPDTNSDPFGYTSEKIRQEKGELYYDFDTGEAINCNSSSSGNEYADAIIDLANKEYEINAGKSGEKYNSFFGMSAGTAWCANFVSYLIANTPVKDIIEYRTASTGSFIKYFYNSTKANIKFYYNDSCSFRKGKNGTTTYMPKKGDIIFIDWAGGFKDIETSFGQQDHTAIVEKYVDGIIYTVEGNMGTPSRIKKYTYSISDCRIIGFGSWY